MSLPLREAALCEWVGDQAPPNVIVMYTHVFLCVVVVVVVGGGGVWTVDINTTHILLYSKITMLFILQLKLVE
jgi:hypothetical protein